MMVKVNAMGDACPIPVVKTKNAIKELKGSGTVEVLVDNEIAVQNLTKMANQKGYGVKSEKLAEGEYRVEMIVENSNASVSTDGGQITANSSNGSNTQDAQNGKMSNSYKTENVGTEADVREKCIPDARSKNTVAVISSSVMGSGDDELGAILMKGFIYALSQQDELPSTVLLYNGGAKLACEQAPTLDDLKSLEAQGVEILTCGTCLNHYGLTDKLAVGSVTNMYVIVTKMSEAGLIIRP